MDRNLFPVNRGNRLENKVTLIINGLNESGRNLAVLLARKGSDVAVVGFQPQPHLASTICKEVQTNGRHCLVLTPDMMPEATGKPFAQEVIRRVLEKFGRLDIFVNYSEASHEEAVTPANGRALIEQEAAAESTLGVFDRFGVTQAVLKHIVST